MPKILAVLVALVLPFAASPQGVSRGTVTTSKISTASPARYVSTVYLGLVAASATVANFYYPFPGGAKLVDVVVVQQGPGVGGTSVAVDVKDGAATSLLTAAAVATLASGAGVGTDARGNMSLPSGWTRPVLKTGSAVVVAQGGRIQFTTTETGTYSTHPTLSITLVFEPLQ